MGFPYNFGSPILDLRQLSQALKANFRAAEKSLGATVPLGGMIDYASAAEPTDGIWKFPNGQAISRTNYAALFQLIGTTYGAGDGSTTFNLPDVRGRTGVPLDNLGGTDAGRLSIANTLGGSGGEELHTLTAAESGVAPHGHGVTDPGHGHGWSGVNDGAAVTLSAGTYPFRIYQDRLANWSGTASYIGNNTTGLTVQNHAGAAASAAHNNMQPYLLIGKLIRVA